MAGRLRVLLLLLALLLPAGVRAQDAAIADLVVANSPRQLLLYLAVKNAFSPEMEEAVRNGIGATFTFSVELYKVRGGLPDRRIAAVSFDHILSYDNLKDEFTVILGEHGSRRVRVRDIDRAKKLMIEVNEAPVCDLEVLEPDADYTLRAKALLDRRTLPFKLHYLMPFLSLWDFNTDWYSLSFRY